MSCTATFNFIRGPCVGRVITHDFDAGATVAHMKRENALQKDLDAAALDLVEIAEGLRPLSDREAAQVAAVRGRLGWV